VGLGQFAWANANTAGFEAHAVELVGVVEDGGQAPGAYVRADAFDHLDRRDRLAEDLLGEFPAAG
jgi:hypothetical protein